MDLGFRCGSWRAKVGRCDVAVSARSFQPLQLTSSILRWGPRTGGVVSQLHWIYRDGPRLAGRCSEAHSVRHEECLGIADR